MTDRPNPLATPIRGAATLTVTLFGDNDRIDHALSEELGRRGCRTHAVSVETGWLRSAENVICRLDTEAGQRALEGLAGRDQPRATVVAVCEKPTDEYALKRLHDLCEECGRHHDVSLIWHSAVADADRSPTAHSSSSPCRSSTRSPLGSATTNRPSSFTSRFVDLG